MVIICMHYDVDKTTAVCGECIRLPVVAHPRKHAIYVGVAFQTVSYISVCHANVFRL